MKVEAITKQTIYGTFRYRSDTGDIYWGEDSFWENWPKLAAAGVIRADYGDSSNWGHISLYAF